MNHLLTLLNLTPSSFDQNFYTRPKPVTGIDDLRSRQVGHGMDNGGLQGVDSVVSAFFVVAGIQVWAAWRPELLRSEHILILGPPILN